MWTQAKLKFRQLLFDDSGVAMAYTIVTFLVFFMICISTYAMSENIRRKMELQNACDAAAYSAAVVQADMLSRIAVLNRALSWTYAETNKRQMDEIVHNWLGATLANFDKMKSSTLEAALISNAGCLCGGKDNISNNGSSCGENGTLTPVFWMVGTSDGGVTVSNVIPDTIWLNYPIGDQRRKGVNEIATARTQYISQQTQIDNGINNADIINREINTIIQNMNTYITTAAKVVAEKYFDPNTDIQENKAITPETQKISEIFYSNQLSFAIIQTMATSYFSQETSENNLLAYNTNQNASDIFQNGCNVWWINSNTEDGGIRRIYSQTENSLISKFKIILGVHSDTPGFPCVHSASDIDPSGLLGTIQGQPPLNNLVARPQKLRASFFGKAGSIIVAAQINSTNPLSVLFGASGIYNQNLYFGRRLLAVSAARAGIHLITCLDGEYSVFYPGETFDGYHNGVWNLCEDNWDAVMLPINRAWCPASEGAPNFGKYDENEKTEYSSNAILQEVYQRFNRSGECPANVDDVMWH